MSGQGPEISREENTTSAESALAWARANGSGARVAEHSRQQRRRRESLRRRLAAAACGCVLVIAGVCLWPRSATTDHARNLPSSVAVSLPEMRTLPDGSLVELRGEARIDVQYGPKARRVVLVTGDAHFSVAKSPVPFIVVATGLEVRAVGTQFLVQTSTPQMEVMVTEGRVVVETAESVSRSDGGSDPSVRAPTLSLPIMLEAGNTAVVDMVGGVATCWVKPVSPTESMERLAWRTPRIELSATPLSDALAVFNRYSSVRLRLADPTEGSKELSGVLRPDNPTALLRVLQVEFGLEADPQRDGEILLRRP